MLRHAGRWPAPSILRFDVGRGALLSMVGQGFGITIVGAASALLPTTGIVFLPFADEPEPAVEEDPLDDEPEPDPVEGPVGVEPEPDDAV